MRKVIHQQGDLISFGWVEVRTFWRLNAVRARILSQRILFVGGYWLMLSCTSVGAEEKNRVLEKIIGKDEVPVVSEPTPPKTESSSVALLPLPRGVLYSDLSDFMSLHSDVMGPYQPLSEEWNSYARWFVDVSVANETELKAMQLRIRGDYPRAHWLFVWGLRQTSERLLGRNQASPFVTDLQEDFLRRMSLLLFISNELKNVTGRTDYRALLKDFYKNANAKYFKRPLTDRPVKSNGALQPDQNPQDQTLWPESEE